MTSTPVISMRGGAVRLDGREVWADADLDVGAGEFVAILGPNGAGKSTLIKAILGQVPLAKGTLQVLGHAPGAANRDIGYLPQRRGFDAAVRIRAIDVVRLGRDGHRWGLPLRRGRRDGDIDQLLDLVGASAYADRAIGELSGGEQQRILIAQALIRRPRILLLDEPLDSLDLTNQASVSALIARVAREQEVAVLLVAHDINPILPYVDGVTYLARGRAVTGAPTQVITSETLSELYDVPVEVLRTRDGRLVVVGQPEPPAHHADRHEH